MLMLQSQLLGYISIAGPNEKNGRIESWLQNEASSLTSFDLAPSTLTTVEIQGLPVHL